MFFFSMLDELERTMAEKESSPSEKSISEPLLPVNPKNLSRDCIDQSSTKLLCSPEEPRSCTEGTVGFNCHSQPPCDEQEQRSSVPEDLHQSCFNQCLNSETAVSEENSKMNDNMQKTILDVLGMVEFIKKADLKEGATIIESFRREILHLFDDETLKITVNNTSTHVETKIVTNQAHSIVLELTTKVTELTEKCRETYEENQFLKTHIESLIEQKTSLEDNVTNAENYIFQLKTEMQAATQERNELTEKNLELARKLSVTESALEFEKKETQKLREHADAHYKDKNVAEDRVRKLAQERAVLRGNSAAFSKLLQSCLAECAHLKADKQSLEAELQQERVTAEDLRLRLDAIVTDVNSSAELPSGDDVASIEQQLASTEKVTTVGDGSDDDRNNGTPEEPEEESFVLVK